MGQIWPCLVSFFHVSDALRALSGRIIRYHMSRRACLWSNSIQAREKLHQRRGKLKPTWAKIIWDFLSFFSANSSRLVNSFGPGLYWKRVLVHTHVREPHRHPRHAIVNSLGKSCGTNFGQVVQMRDFAWFQGLVAHVKCVWRSDLNSVCGVVQIDAFNC